MQSLGEDRLANWNAAYFYGVHTQKQLDKNYIGINVPFGELNADQFFELARISEKYGDSNIRTTLSQNLIISGVTNELIPAILNEPILKNFSPAPRPFIGHSVACTGKEWFSTSKRYLEIHLIGHTILVIKTYKKNMKSIIHFSKIHS